MSIHRPETRHELIQYCLRALGHPVLEINVSEDQVEDRFEEALQYYREFHSDSMIRDYRKHIMTDDDISNKYISIPENIMSVTKLFPLNGLNGSRGYFSAEYQMFKDDIFGIHGSASDGLLHYDMAKTYLATMDMLLRGESSVRFNRHMGKLFIDVEWGKDIKEGDTILIECYNTIDPDEYVSIYNDPWLKKYLIELIRLQWGSNLIKYENMQLPGGVTLNGRSILEDAKNRIKELEEEMQSTHTYPIDFFVG